jgi:hypothetical protein
MRRTSGRHRPDFPALLVRLLCLTVGLAGTLAATGGAAAPASAATTDNRHSIYTLDGWGGVHPVGDSPSLPTSVYWQGWDIARGLALNAGGDGGYVLDGWGGVHPVGSAAPLTSGVYWRGWDIARSLALNSSGSGGYVLDGWGGVHPFGAASAVAPSVYWRGWDIARGIACAQTGPAVTSSTAGVVSIPSVAHRLW